MNTEEILLNEMVSIINRIKDMRYDELLKEGYLETLTKDEIIAEINIYGGNITKTDIIQYKKSFQYIRINNTDEYKVFLDFWIDNERSDLTLVCNIELDSNNNIINSVIDEVHVL